MCASARDMPLGVAWAARRLIRTAARLWLPVRAALTSIVSNSSPDRSTTLDTLPTAAVDNPGAFLLPAGALERVPETAAQRMPDLIVQQEVDRQRRALQQPRLQVRRHARLPGQHRLQPQRRGIPGHRTAELLAFLVRRLHGLRQRHAGRRTPRVLVAGAGRA